jgi:hypothetical protein
MGSTVQGRVRQTRNRIHAPPTAKEREEMNTAKFTCGVPEHHCGGGLMRVSQGIKIAIKSGTMKVHSSSEEAFRCRARYLTKVKGYTRVGNREFAPPDGGPIEVLAKKSHFGGQLRKGKSAEASSGITVMPKRHMSGLVARY